MPLVDVVVYYPELQDAGDMRHAQEVMRALGLTYRTAHPFPIGDCWAFHGVESGSIPAALPVGVYVREREGACYCEEPTSKPTMRG
jgi:hypothetical protein